VKRLLLILLAAAPLPAQQSAPVFRADVSLVRIDVGFDSAPRTREPLKAEDFMVRDTGRPQAIRHIAHTETPLDLILLFDISGSMEPGIAKVAEGARAALAELRPGDRVAVYSFSNVMLRLLAFTQDLELVRRCLEEVVPGMPFGGGTPLRPAIHETARLFPPHEGQDRRRGVLVITDNRGQDSGIPVEQTIGNLWKADVVVTGLVLRVPGSPSGPFPIGVTRGARQAIHRQKYGASMDEIASATGGEMLYTRQPERDFQNVLHRLRQRYSLYFEPPPGQPGELRTVQVELTREALRRTGRVKLQARTGYRLPGLD